MVRLFMDRVRAKIDTLYARHEHCIGGRRDTDLDI